MLESDSFLMISAVLIGNVNEERLLSLKEKRPSQVVSG